MVAAQVAGDLEMFALALQETVEDERNESVMNVIRALSEDLAGIIVDVHGEQAADWVRLALVSQLASEDK